MAKLSVLVGDRFGKLSILKEVESHVTSGGNKKRKFLCRCDCGREKTVMLQSLKRGLTVSCGCFQREQSGKSLARVATTHGLSQHPLYFRWCGIKARCNAHEYYRDKQISVCDEWKQSFVTFYDWAISNGWYDGAEIDRIDNSKGYSPDNCRWVSRSTNMRNTTRQRPISFRGKTQSLRHWSEELGIGFYTLRARLVSLGWSVDRALSTSTGSVHNNQHTGRNR